MTITECKRKTLAMIATTKCACITAKKNPIAQNIGATEKETDSWNANIVHSLIDLLKI